MFLHCRNSHQEFISEFEQRTLCLVQGEDFQTKVLDVLSFVSGFYRYHEEKSRPVHWRSGEDKF